jgi:hypothetical protein
MNAQLKYLVALAMLLAPSVSFAHSWYDPACCADQDCKPVPVTDLKKHPDGRWEYLPLHQYFNPDQERPSGDANYHICIGVTRPEEFGGMAAPIYIPRCIYVPPIRSSMSASPAPSSIFLQEVVSRFWNGHEKLLNEADDALKRQNKMPATFARVVFASDRPQSAQEIAGSRRKALANGADAFLTKPIDFAIVRVEIDMRIRHAA